MENKQSFIDKIFSAGLTIGTFIGTLFVGFFLINFFFDFENKTSNTDNVLSDKEININNQEESKKESLEKYYNISSTAHQNKDWATLYEFEPKSIRNLLTKEEFIEIKNNSSENQFISRNTIIREIIIEGDKGTVFRQITFCFSDDCDGENRKIDDGSAEFEYVDGKWYIPDFPEPSERALKVATNLYLEVFSKNKESKKKFYDHYSYGKENPTFAIKRHALYLDDNLEKLIFAEESLNNIEENKNKNYSNYDSDPFIIQPNTNNQPSVWDKVKEEQKQKCQEEMTKYNSCMAEYNTKLAEYNACLNEVSNPSSWRYGGYCSKPFQICRKPYCAN